ncbi:MAG TPA: tRNA (adenine-N1)-methyltransferase [Candidatus Desulfofervidus auxilii]|uniref:tRNA (adenine(58)-N(1))-methyltransferase TrmI n=1 Tax=Desulfofervidus auxilii TaxID=1621989 RepID=A0A7V0I9P2_DESA2|nr:tRNA (adenine-N1)-methyltransferase [Candidatus Desulfofervidus auxilii]
MPWQRDELALLLSPEGKRFLVKIELKKINTHHGEIDLKKLLNVSPGNVVYTHKGIPFITLKPTLYDLIHHLIRRTQIIYPKDLGYILVRLGIAPGSKVIEAGSGSGALTLTLAWWVRPTGQVFSYEKEERFIKICQQNLDWSGLNKWVKLKHKDIEEGFDEREVDAIFLDVKTPWQYLYQAWKALKGGAVLGMLVPTTNQIVEILKAINGLPFVDIEIMELLLRKYKPVAERLRPTDRMVAHTGYLVFARKMTKNE